MNGSGKHLAAADVLRVAAIALIGWYHFWQQSWLDPGFFVGNHYVNLQQMVRHGYLMVDVMLVLSGFLLALPHARARRNGLAAPGAKDFYLRRFWRIVPSYLLGVLAVFFLYALPNGLYANPGDALKDLLAHLTFTHNLFPDLLGSTPLLGVLWTVGVEVQFYILFPLIVGLYRDRPGLTCLTLTLLAVTTRLWVIFSGANTVFWVNQLPCMLDLFACGMAAALGYARLEDRPLRPRTRRWMAVGAGIAFLCLLQILYIQTTGDYDIMRREQLLWRLAIGALSGAFLLCGSLAPAGLSRVWGNRLTRFLAGISYNFYIWHQFLATRLKDLRIPPYTSQNPNQSGEQPWQLLYTLFCFAGAIAVAAAVTWLWEKPWYTWGLKKHAAKSSRSPQ